MLLLPTVDKCASVFHSEALFPFAICQVPFHAPFEDRPVNKAPSGKTSSLSDCHSDGWWLQIKFPASPDGEAPRLLFDKGVKFLQDQSWTTRRAVTQKPDWEPGRPGVKPCTYFGQVI